MYQKSSGNFINGTWVVEKSKQEEIVSISPGNGEIIWKGECASPETIEFAVESAQQAFEEWSSLSLDARIECVQRYKQIVESNRDELARRISLEVGKPLWEANAEVNSVLGKLEPSIEAYKLRNTEIIRQQGEGYSVTRFKPHGVVAIIGPYNFPAHMPNGHIIPALLAGNTIIMKPSEKVPFTSEFIMKLWEQAGLPYGVINMVHGKAEAGEQLCLNSKIKGVFFTGSYLVGRKIEKACSGKKICALEMGGNSPLIVWDSSNIDACVVATIQSSFVTSGQRCSSARRVIIPRNDFGEEFLSRLVETVCRINVNIPNAEPQPFMGPMKDSALVNNLLKKQEELREAGGKVLVECKNIKELGEAYVTPGIMDVTNINRDDEEIIGPFIQLIRVNSFEEALYEANNTSYGLAAGIFTEDETLYRLFQKEIKAGIINWNQQLTGASGWAPFGGIKNSGNYHTSGFLATDYCVYSTASLEFKTIKLPVKLPEGISLY